jgi:CHAT domain-containing protein/tetratricopeptide (TPR) repeat protein
VRTWLTLFCGISVFAGASAAPDQPAVAGTAIAIRAYHDALRSARDGRLDDALEWLRLAVQADPAFARAYTKTVEFSQERQEPDAARAYFEQLLDRPGMAPYAHYALGLFFLRQRQLQFAELHLKQCIEMLPEFAPAYTQLVGAALQDASGEEKAAYLRKLAQSNPKNAAARYGLAYLYQQQGDAERARDELEKANNLDSELWEVLSLRYELYSQSAQSPEALRVLKTMLRKAEDTGHLEWEAHVRGRMGTIYSDLGDYSQAIPAFEQAIAITRDLGDRRNEQAFEGQLGLVYFYQARYREALAECTRALEMARETGDSESEGRDLGLIAMIHAETADYTRAIEEYQHAGKIARETGDRASQAHQLASLALVYMTLGYHTKALRQLRTALAAARELKNQWLEGQYLESIGEVYASDANYAGALQAYESGLKVATRIGDRLGEAARLAYSAEIRGRMNDPVGALHRLEQALEITNEIGAMLVEGRILNDLGVLYRKAGRTDRARESHQKALALGQETNTPSVIWQAEAGLAKVCESEGEFASARTWYQQAIERVEQVRANLAIADEKAGFLADKVQVYKDLISLLVRMHRSDPGAGYDAEAFRYVERSRARASLDLLAEAESKIDSGIEPSALQGQREIEGRISHLHRQLAELYGEAHKDPAKIAAITRALDAADEEFRTVRRQVHDQNPRYAAFRYPEAIDLRHTQEHLPERAVLLEYTLGNEESFLFAVTRHDYLLARLPAAPQLTARIRALREAVAAGPGRAALSNYWVAAQSLYRDLVRPANRLLAGRTELIVAADGILNYLPFAALVRSQDPAPATIDPAQLPYLVRSYAIGYVPSASVLGVLRRQRTAVASAKMFLAYADPNVRGLAQIDERGQTAELRRFAPLANSRAEVKRIARLYPPDGVDVRVGESASEQDVKNRSLEHYRTIQFAVHGLLNEDNPQYSGLALTRPSNRASEDDGLLQVYEIFNLKLNADLVVLSACQTGLGKNVKGEGLVGLTQAFFYAGARSVAASLWNVDDRSTADLMVQFHRHLRSGNLEQAQALRRAQLDLIERTPFAHPYYWAPFVLIGDSSR